MSSRRLLPFCMYLPSMNETFDLGTFAVTSFMLYFVLIKIKDFWSICC